LSPSSFFFSSRRRHTRFSRDWSSDVCSSDLVQPDLECFEIFHTSENLDVGCPKIAHRFRYILSIQHINQNIRSQIAASGNHAMYHIVPGNVDIYTIIQSLIAILIWSERELTAIYYAVESFVHRKSISEF